MTHVRIEGIVKRFGDVVALKGINLEIKHGELFTLLGPSGCGKTTLLRIIAGLEYPDEGRIYFDDQDVTDVDTSRRGAVLVFQNYALWPHMTVFDNIAYGLKLKKVPKQEIEKEVKEVLRLVHLEGYENRYPTQLSGGQQQRVALARALVVKPKILLLDEPLSNLDAKLRVEMRSEIKAIQKELGITLIYVTHDQEEAMALSDRLAVMNIGQVEQVGTPMEVYHRPRTRFVADFMGRNNVLDGKVVEVKDGKATVEVLGFKLKGIPYSGDPGPVTVVIRPEKISLTPFDDACELKGTVVLVEFYGMFMEVVVEIEGQKIFIRGQLPRDVKMGEEVTLYVRPKDVLILPPE